MPGVVNNEQGLLAIMFSEKCGQMCNQIPLTVFGAVDHLLVDVKPIIMLKDVAEIVHLSRVWSARIRHLAS